MRVPASAGRRVPTAPPVEPSSPSEIGRVDPCGALARRWPELLGVGARAILPRHLGDVAAPPVIVVDIAGEEGAALVRLVRAMAPRARLVAVGTAPDDVDDAFRSGADVYVHRSADDAALDAAIHGALPRPHAEARWWRRRALRAGR